MTLRNEDVKDGVTIHWHGVDLPNAEDGVAGVTQNAVLPGASYTYRFRVMQVGTFWYHAHQASASEVRRGLYGALVIEPATNAAPVSGRGADITVAVHTLGGVGFTVESDVQLYFRRAKGWTLVAGDPQLLLDEIADALYGARS